MGYHKNSSILLYLHKQYLDWEEALQSYYIRSFVWPNLQPLYLNLLKESRWLVSKNYIVWFWTTNWLDTLLIKRMNSLNGSNNPFISGWLFTSRMMTLSTLFWGLLFGYYIRDSINNFQNWYRHQSLDALN